MVPDTASRRSMSAVQTVSPEEDASTERWRQWQVRNALTVMPMHLRPLHDRIIVQRLEESQHTGAIVIPDSAKEKPQQGKMSLETPSCSASMQGKRSA